MNETFEQMVERVQKETYMCCDPTGNWELDFAIRLRDELAKGQEPVVIKAPNYHDEAMGCGLEDRGITSRYEAMRYGFDCGVERMLEQIPDESLYTRPFVAAGVPVGWKLVPVEPTDAMVQQAINIGGWRADSWKQVYRAMLSAAPTTPTNSLPTHEQISSDAPTSRKCLHCESMQAQIDRLMIEYCPGEMTKGQLEEWERNQVPAPADPATKDAERWKERAEYEYSRNMYPDNPGLAVGALDASMANGWEWKTKQEAIDAAMQGKEEK